MTLRWVRRFAVPRPLVEESVAIIQRAGSQGDEVFVAWTGVLNEDGTGFEFRRLHVPRQTCDRTQDGLLVRIPGQALFELNRDAHAHGELIGGQIHGHPTHAYHSAADDALALVRLAGGLSVVVPEFARGGLARLGSWTCFRFDLHGRWEPLPSTVEVVIE